MTRSVQVTVTGTWNAQRLLTGITSEALVKRYLPSGKGRVGTPQSQVGVHKHARIPPVRESVSVVK